MLGHALFIECSVLLSPPRLRGGRSVDWSAPHAVCRAAQRRPDRGAKTRQRAVEGGVGEGEGSAPPRGLRGRTPWSCAAPCCAALSRAEARKTVNLAHRVKLVGPGRVGQGRAGHGAGRRDVCTVFSDALLATHARVSVRPPPFSPVLNRDVRAMRGAPPPRPAPPATDYASLISGMNP